MKKVLILAYDFPPYNSVGGKRPYSWYKYFHENGIFPIVVTRYWGNIRSTEDYVRSTKETKCKILENEEGIIIRAPYKSNLRDRIILKYGLERFKIIRKLLTILYTAFQYLFFLFDNKSTIYSEAERYLADNDCDLIIATGEPFILFRYAAKLSKKHNTPWIADYRDGWSLNYGLDSADRLNKVLSKIFYQRIEKQLIKSSLCVTTVSEELKNKLKRLHSRDNIYIINNGYDIEINKNINLQSKDVFQIAYVGTIYPFQRLEVFLEGVTRFTQKKEIDNLRIVFYGTGFYPEQRKRILNYNHAINRYITVKERLPYKDLIRGLKDANALLLLANENIDGSCAKVYDYLAINRKIILTVNDHSTLEKILNNTSSGVICENSTDVELNLQKLYNEWQENGYVSCGTKNIEKYSRKYQAEKLVKLIADYI